MKPYLWALLAALTWGVVPIIEKLGLTKINVFAGLFFRSLGVVFGAVILYLFNHSNIKMVFAENLQGGLFLMLGGLGASIIGQIFFYSALKTGEASQVVPLAAAYPLISFILGIFFLGENITNLKVMGMVCIVAGIWMLK